MGVIGRLDPQKGFDLVAWRGAAAHRRGRAPGRPGHRRPQPRGRPRGAGRGSTPDRVAILERFDRDEARRIYAGSDVFLMPSRFEPSRPGPAHRDALRHGAAGALRRAGSWTPSSTPTRIRRRGNGFRFGPAEPEALLDAVERAFAALADRLASRRIQRAGHGARPLVGQPARAYAAAYERVLARA